MATTSNYDNLSMEQMKKLLAEREIKVIGRATRSSFIKALTEYDTKYKNADADKVGKSTSDEEKEPVKKTVEITINPKKQKDKSKPVEEKKEEEKKDVEIVKEEKGEEKNEQEPVEEKKTNGKRNGKLAPVKPAPKTPAKAPKVHHIVTYDDKIVAVYTTVKNLKDNLSKDYPDVSFLSIRENKHPHVKLYDVEVNKSSKPVEE